MIYFDNAATTAPDAKAVSRAENFCLQQYFNPSALYGGGISVRAEISEARDKLLSKVAGDEYELIFTSGGTESDNQAIFCGSRRGNAVTTAGEHAAVYQSFKELKNRGIEPRFAPVDRYGRVEKEKLLDLVDENTSLISVVHVNNETGAVNDIALLARAVKLKNPRCLFHSDGVQAFGKIPFRIPKEVDLYSLSAHKIGGLKGTGALIKRKNLPIPPLLYGGGQEGNLRSGTENVMGILCFAYAAERKFLTLENDYIKLRGLREKLYELLDKEIFSLISPEEGTPYILTVAARNMRGEILQRLCEQKGVIVGTGSACSSKKPYSRVIEACGYEKSILNGILRLSFSSLTTEQDIVTAAEALNESAREFQKRLGIWKK